MSESFYSKRFEKSVWLTNHAIESMTKRRINLIEVKQLIELGEYKKLNDCHGWIYGNFQERDDNLICAAVVEEQALIIKTMMVQWQKR